MCRRAMHSLESMAVAESTTQVPYFPLRPCSFASLHDDGQSLLTCVLRTQVFRAVLALWGISRWARPANYVMKSWSASCNARQTEPASLVVTGPRPIALRIQDRSHGDLYRWLQPCGVVCADRHPVELLGCGRREWSACFAK